MASQHLEPWLRMAISSVHNAERYVHRIPGHPAQIDAALRDLERAIAHIQKYAEKNKIHIRESMHT